MRHPHLHSLQAFCISQQVWRCPGLSQIWIPAEHHRSCSLNIQLQERSPQPHLPALYKTDEDCQVCKMWAVLDCLASSKQEAVAWGCRRQCKGVAAAADCQHCQEEARGESEISEGTWFRGRERKRSLTICSSNSCDPWFLRAISPKAGRSQYLHPAVSLAHTIPSSCCCPWNADNLLLSLLQFPTLGLATTKIVLNAIEAWNCLWAICQANVNKDSMQKMCLWPDWNVPGIGICLSGESTAQKSRCSFCLTLL